VSTSLGTPIDGDYFELVKRYPNMVEVNADGCSCYGLCRMCKRSDVDVACPTHGEPLTHGDGDVLVVHHDGTMSVIAEPEQ
jgi:hypothetical protein